MGLRVAIVGVEGSPVHGGAHLVNAHGGPTRVSEVSVT